MGRLDPCALKTQLAPTTDPIVTPRPDYIKPLANNCSAERRIQFHAGNGYVVLSIDNQSTEDIYVAVLSLDGWDWTADQIKKRRGAHADQVLAGPTTWAQAVVTEMYKTKWLQISPYIFSKADYFLFLSVLSGCVLSAAFRTRSGTSVTTEERSRILSMLISRYFNDPLREDGNYEACSDIENGKSNFVTAIGLLLEHGADPGTLGILSATVEKANGPGNSHILQAQGMTYCSSWDYFQDHVAQATQDELSRDLWRDDPKRRDLALLTAVNHLRIYQHFLSANVNVTEKVERVLEQLNQSVNQPLSGHGHFEREYLDQFKSEYQRARDMIRKKRMVSVRRPQLRVW